MLVFDQSHDFYSAAYDAVKYGMFAVHTPAVPRSYFIDGAIEERVFTQAIEVG